MTSIPDSSILDLVVAEFQSGTGNDAVHDTSEHTIRRLLSFIGPQTGGLGSALGELEEPPIRAWLTELGREPGEGYPWMMKRVAERTFSLWALSEFVRFICDPLDHEGARRLLAATSPDSRLKTELPMSFAKAVWLGYFCLVDHALAYFGVRWTELPRGHYPKFVDWKGTAQQPVDRWPVDGRSWSAFAVAHGSQTLRLNDTRLRVRQLVALAAPSRSGSVGLLGRLGQSLVNPSMQAVRPVKDGHKGTAGELPALAHLVAACAGDRLFMSRLVQASCS